MKISQLPNLSLGMGHTHLVTLITLMGKLLLTSSFRKYVPIPDWIQKYWGLLRSTARWNVWRTLQGASGDWESTIHWSKHVLISITLCYYTHCIAEIVQFCRARYLRYVNFKPISFQNWFLPIISESLSPFSYLKMHKTILLFPMSVKLVSHSDRTWTVGVWKTCKGKYLDLGKGT